MDAVDLARRWIECLPLAARTYGRVIKGERKMRDEYAIAIERVGLVDLPELCRASDPPAAAEIVRALLSLHDPLIRAVHISIVRLAN